MFHCVVTEGTNRNGYGPPRPTRLLGKFDYKSWRGMSGSLLDLTWHSIYRPPTEIPNVSRIICLPAENDISKTVYFVSPENGFFCRLYNRLYLEPCLCKRLFKIFHKIRVIKESPHFFVKTLKIVKKVEIKSSKKTT